MNTIPQGGELAGCLCGEDDPAPSLEDRYSFSQAAGHSALAPWLADVVAEVLHDGQLKLAGRAGPDGALVEIRVDSADDWRAVAGVSAGRFVNPSIYDSYVYDPRVVNLRVVSGTQVSAVLQVKTYPQLQAANALRTASGSIAVGGRCSVPGAGVWAEKRDGTGRVPIGDVLTQGTFLNPRLSDFYTVRDDLMRLWFSNGWDPSNDPVIGPFDVPIDRWKPLISGVTAEMVAPGRMRVRGATDAPASELHVRLEGGAWQNVGHAGTPSFDVVFEVAPHAQPENVHVQLHANEAPSFVVGVTVGWAYSRALAISAWRGAQEEQLRLQRMMRLADYQPTAFFARRNVPFTVMLGPVAGFVELSIGLTSLADRDDRQKVSQPPRWHVLKPGLNELPGDPHGGLIHVRYLRAAADMPMLDVNVVLGDEVQAVAFYQDGETSIDQWRAMLKDDSLAPEAVMSSGRVIVVGFVDELRKYADEDPQAVLAMHRELLDIEHDIAGLVDGTDPLHQPPTLPVYATRSGNGVNPHATYAGTIGIPGYVDELLFTTRGRSHWMMFHEYGHHQQLAWQDTSNAGLVEVVVNIYSLACWRRNSGEPGGPALESAELWPIHQAYLALPRQKKTFGDYRDENGVDPPHLEMAPFDQLRRGLGSQFIREWHRKQREFPLASRDRFGQKLGMIVNASRAARQNLCNFFADWGILKEGGADKAIWDEVAALGFPEPRLDMTTLPPFIHYELPDELSISRAVARVTASGTLDVQGHAGPEGSVITLFSPHANQWRGIADVKQGRFANADVPASYFDNPRQIQLRVEHNGLISPVLDVRCTPVVLEAHAYWNPAGKLVVSGRATPVDSIVHVQSRSGGWVGIASVTSAGTFANATLSDYYLWNDDLVRLRLWNAWDSSHPSSEPLELQVSLKSSQDGIA